MLINNVEIIVEPYEFEFICIETHTDEQDNSFEN